MSVDSEMSPGHRILEVDSVEKTFQTVKAVDRLSFHVDKGEIFALLGPNGAGKTTLVRLLIGLFHADAGRVSLTLDGGASGAPDPTRIGYLPEDRGLYKELPVLRTLTYFGILRGLRRAQARESAECWLERLGLRDRAEENLGALSKGNQQRVQFVSSILHDPEFVILDEPFSGLDPLNQNLFLDYLTELRDRGTTVLLCAHQMQLVERVADRLLLINRGREVLHGSLAEILAGRAGNKITLTLSGPPDPDLLQRNPVVNEFRWDETAHDLTLLVHEGTRLTDLLTSLPAKPDIVNIHSEKLSLHDIFIQSVGESSDASTSEDLM